MPTIPLPAGKPSNARGIPRTGLCRVSGNDLAAQNDEPEPLSEEQRLAIDHAHNDLKNNDPFRQREADRASRLEPR